MNLQRNQFDYSLLDNSTASILREKESKMMDIVSNAYTELGKELKEAQEELAKRGYGCFEEWYLSLGFKKQTVYNCINRYELIVQHLDKQDLIEGLPLTLSYEISKPSIEPELKKKVLDGEIDSLKELREVKKALQEAEQRAAKAEAAAIHNEKLWRQAQNQPPRIETKTVEVVPEEIKRELQSRKYKIEGLERSLQQTQERLETIESLKTKYEKDSKEYAEMKKQIAFLHQEKDNLHRQIESATALSGLAVKIDNFLKTELSPIRYSRALERLDSEVAVRNLTEIIQSVEHWCEDMRRYLPDQNRIIVEAVSYDPAS